MRYREAESEDQGRLRTVIVPFVHAVTKVALDFHRIGPYNGPGPGHGLQWINIRLDLVQK